MFSARALNAKMARAQRRRGVEPPFLIQRCIDDLSDRILDVTRQFQRAVLIGPLDWRAEVAASLPPEKRFSVFDWLAEPARDPSGDYDLVISLLAVQTIEDLPGWMRAARGLLRADGLFIASLLGGQSLSELRQALYALDTEALGSPSPRIHPMIEVRQAAPLLGHAGLALPVIDSDKISVSYGRMTRLAADLRDVGLTNSLTGRTRRPVRDLKTLLDGPGDVTFEIVWMTGWSPHESQQKPLKPGSAQMGLGDALNVIRNAPKDEANKD